MIRVLAILWTALVAVLTAAGAISILSMPVKMDGPAMILLGCAGLLAVVCVAMIAQGSRRPHAVESGTAAALVAPMAPPAAPPARKSVHNKLARKKPDDLSQVGKPLPRKDATPPKPTRLRAETRDAENLLNVEPRDDWAG